MPRFIRCKGQLCPVLQRPAWWEAQVVGCSFDPKFLRLGILILIFFINTCLLGYVLGGYSALGVVVGCANWARLCLGGGALSVRSWTKKQFEI